MTSRRKVAIFLSGSVALFGAVVGVWLVPWSPGEPEARLSKEVLSPYYKVDRIYKSMKGPRSRREVHLEDRGARELLWITGYRAVMVGKDGTTPRSQEYMCHSSLDFHAGEHMRIFGTSQERDGRLFTLSQGQLSIELPAGFGVPMMSDEALLLTTQVLNLNESRRPHYVRHKVTIDYVRDRDLPRAMKPLYQVGVYGLKLLEGDAAYPYLEEGDEKMHGPGCLVGSNASGGVIEDPFGRKFTGHWVVKPGREENHTLVTKLLNLTYDTAVHYIAVHLHPFAESMELKDLTTGETLFKSKVEPLEGRIGIDRVDYFSSAEGLPVYRDHEYEVVSVYNNTTDQDQDSMAVFYMYLLDKEFDKRELNSAVTPPRGAIGQRGESDRAARGGLRAGSSH